MTLQEKISQAYKWTYDLSVTATHSVNGLSAVRLQALQIKKLMQDIASTARTAQKRKCTHANLDTGHRSIRHWHNTRTITVHYNCVDCGKTSIKTDEIERIDTTEPNA